MENKNMIMPPLTVEYNMPKGPKKKESISAKTMLFEDTMIVVFGSEVFMVLIVCCFLRVRRYADPAMRNCSMLEGDAS